MASKRGTLSTKLFSDELLKALNQAARLMGQKKQPVMTAELLLLGYIAIPETEAHRLLREFSQVRGFDWESFARDVERSAGDRQPARDEQFDFVADNGKRVSLGREILIVLDDGLSLAEGQGEKWCGSVHTLAVMADIRIGTHWLLSRRGITKEAIIDSFTMPAPAGEAAPARGGAVQPVYHRGELQDKLTHLLSMTQRRNVILIGPSGVGKRSLVLCLEQLIREGRGPAGLKGVVELDEQALLGGDPLKVVDAALRRAKGGILFAPDIDRFFGGIRSDFGQEAGNLVQKQFFSDEVVIIGTATEEAYSEKLSKARPIVERSQILRVPPATVEESIEILKVLRPQIEADYGVTIADKSLEEAARLAGRYYTIKPLPEAAVYMLHQTGAMLRSKLHAGIETGVKDDKKLDPDDVMVAASVLTGIPVAHMGADERNRYVNMADHLHRRIIGQREAVLALSRAVKMARVGLKDPKRPIGSFLFLGPTGVGKTELAKALAEFMFGTERALISLDMSEFMEAASVNRLIGSPPGYVGYQSGGQLTEAVKKQPYSVVLFDEVEKADVKVFDVLLQVMEEGRLTSGQGETVSFSECVILMTTNIGGRHLADPRLSEDLEQQIEKNGDYGRPAYRLNNIRKLLDQGFSFEELVSHFYSDPLFASLVDGLNKDLDKAEVIEQLIAQANQKSQLNALLELARQYNPAKYEEHEPYYNWAVACEKAAEELKSHFRPEFLNRLDDIIYFHPLSEDHLRQILDLLLKSEFGLLKAQNLELQVTNPAKNWLLKQNDHPEWGARPLKRLIQRYIREPMADFLLKENPGANTTLTVKVKNSGLVFEAK